MIRRVYFYGFQVPRLFLSSAQVICQYQNVRNKSQLTTKFSQIFSVCNSKTNSIQRKKHLMLFVADEDDGSGTVQGRLIKIKQGKAKRVDVDNGKEWLEELRRTNGLEEETYVLIKLNEGVMIAEFNSAAFGILAERNSFYFNDVLKINNTVLKPLGLPDAFKRLIDSKFLEGYNFNIDDGDKRLSELLFGQSFGGWMRKHIGNQTKRNGGKVKVSVDVRFTAQEANFSKEELEDAKKAVDFDKDDGKIDQAEVITENGIFSLISKTFINDTIEYDEEAVDMEETLFNEMETVYDRKKDDVVKAVKIEMPKNSQHPLDFFSND